MLYPKNQEFKLEEELFKNPTKEYRGTPFWSWNTKVNKIHIENTLSELKEMGMGGAHIHCRTGMDLPYLSQEFMDMVKYAHDKANELDMLTWLYDEDRWPSGAAGGLVTKDLKYRMRFLVLSPAELPENTVTDEVFLEASAKAVRSGNRRFLSRYAVKLEDGFLGEYHCLKKGETVPAGYEEWFAYLEISGSSAWYNNQAYLNTLDKGAVERFIQITHEAYHRELGEHFGDTIPAIFTDEPQFSTKTMMGFAAGRETVTVPYTDDFEETYYQTHKVSFLEHLPEIFWDLPGNEISSTRYHYHDHICERFTSAFADTVGSWCREHNIMLVGHMMQEPSLYSQTSALGEAMRSYRNFGIPGIDMLCDRRELTTAKQAQSASHQYGCPGVLSELYGVTNWDFDFRGHKMAGDWQAALGVTVRVHHLTWTSMAGEAKRDYPAPIGYQSPWYKEYTLIEDYFARLNTALTRGSAAVKVGVIHPVESYWLYWGTKEKTEGIRKEMDQNFQQLTKWLLYGLMDFDFISESLLPELQPMEDAASQEQVTFKEQDTSQEQAASQWLGFKVGKMKYDVILVPNCVTLRKTTLERLKAYAENGGKVIFAGKIPEYMDAIKSREAHLLADKCNKIGFNEKELLLALQPHRFVDIRTKEGFRTDNMLYQLRNDNGGKWLFLTHSEKPKNLDIPEKEVLTITLEGLWEVTKYDAMSGTITQCVSDNQKSKTYIHEEIYEQDSLLYHLKPIRETADSDFNAARTGLGENKVISDNTIIQPISYPEKLSVKLSEPNVLLLDMAEYQMDDGEWMPKEEILRIDNLFRNELGYPLRTEAFPQPWTDSEEKIARHKLSLRFRIYAEEKVLCPSLALENTEITEVILNNVKVSSAITGWYTDRDIQTISLPVINAGENVLVVTIPFHSKRNVEYMYLLMDGRVSVTGLQAVILKPERNLSFGDICPQGLPFYGGNVTYEIPVETQDGELWIEISQFRCPVIKVAVDGIDKGCIAFSPYRLNLGMVSEGKHCISVTAFGNRVNTFGTVHNCNHKEFWIGPNAWRSTGTAWAYEYQLKPSGILVSPLIWVVKK